MLKGEGKIMKLKNTVAILALMSALILTNFIGSQVVSVEPVPPIVPLPSGPFEKFGPRIDRLTFKVAGSVSSEAYDLEQGAIDFMDWSAPGDRWDSWLYDKPEITMGDYSELSVLYFAPNHARWPFGHGDMQPAGYDWSLFGGEIAYTGTHDLSRWPQYLQDSTVDTGGTADTYFTDYDGCKRCQDARHYRRALSHLINRAAMVAGIKGIVPIETLVLPAIRDTWENEAVLGMYPYDLDLAKQELELGGFKNWDSDPEGILEYSRTHDGNNLEALPSIEFYIRQDDPDRIYAATLFFQDMKLMGIPNTPLITTNQDCSIHAWQTYEYDLYTEYWDWGIALPDVLYEGFHSRKDEYPRIFTDNADRYHDLEYDAAADAFYTAPSAAEAVGPCKQMQWIMARDAVVFPTYDYAGYMAHRTWYRGKGAEPAWPGEDAYAGLNWAGVDNEVGLGFIGPEYWTYLNARPQGIERGLDGKCTLRQGLVNYPTTFNVLKTWWFYDMQVIEQIYQTLAKIDPLNGSRYEPWLCDDYTVGTWAGGTAINVTLIPSILWQDATTENPWTLKAEDVGYSWGRLKEVMAPGYYPNVKDFDSYVVHPSVWSDKHMKYQEVVELRFSKQSWLIESYLTGTVIIPKHIWEGKDPAWDPTLWDAVIGTGPFRFFKDGVVGRLNVVPGQFVYVERNPAYFRKFVRPEFYPYNETTGEVGDGRVRIGDFTTVTAQAGYGDPDWLSDVYGPLADVNKDKYVDSDDVMEVAVRMGQTGYVEGYPSYYAWPTGEITLG